MTTTIYQYDFTGNKLDAFSIANNVYTGNILHCADVPVAELTLSGSSGITISGIRIEVFEAPAAAMTLAGSEIPELETLSITFPSPAAGMDFSGVVPVIDFSVPVPAAELELEGTTVSVALRVGSPPAGLDFEGVLPDSITAALLELISPAAEVELSGADVDVHLYFPPVVHIKVNAGAAELDIEGATPLVALRVPACSPAALELSGVAPTVYRGDDLTLTETIFVWDDVALHSGFPVADTLAMTDSVEVKLILLLNEYISIRDTLTSQWTGNLTVSEDIAMADTVTWVRALYETVSETFAIADTVTPELCLLVTDYMLFRETLTAPAIFTKTVSETMAMTDSVVVGWLLSLVESLDIADAITLIKTVNETVNETVTFTDVISALGVFNVTVSDTAVLSDYAKDCIGLYLSETLAMTDGVTCFSEMVLALAESMSFVDALSVAIETTLSVSDNIVIVDTVSSVGVLYATIQDGFHLDIAVELDGEIYECWVLNTPGFYPSIYSGFDFNSYCEYQGRSFGANASGIFELTGDTDNGTAIHSGILLHETDFGARNDKRFRKAYIGLSGDAPVMVMETGDGERKAYTIDDKGKVDASRSMHSRDWVLSVADFDTIDSIHLVPVILARGK